MTLNRRRASPDLVRLMLRQFRHEYAQELESDEDGYTPDHDTVLKAAIGEFHRVLKAEFRELIHALQHGLPMPDTPAFDHLTH